MKDLFGQALLDYYHNKFAPPLLLHNEYGAPEAIPVEKYFFNADEFSNLEVFALQQVSGKVLDVGAATGRHVLLLQNQGFDITALDVSPLCVKLMEEVGIEKLQCQDIYSYNDESYGTVLMLMNGIGIAGNIAGLHKLLNKLKTIVDPYGQLIIDSSDISYLYDGKSIPMGSYFGELSFQYEYKGELDDAFNWLYIDQKKLVEVAYDSGWSCQIIFSDETDAYLARLQQL